MSIKATVKSRIPAIRMAMDDKVDTTLRTAVAGVEAEAKSRVAVDSGALRDAIHTERETEGYYRVVAGDSDTFYGHLVERGGVKVPPRPFLVPALESRRDDILAAVNRTLKGL